MNETTDPRAEMIAAIRSLADLLESQPSLPLPHSIKPTAFPHSNEGVFDCADILGVPVKRVYGAHPNIAATLNLGHGVSYEVYDSIGVSRARPDVPVAVTREDVLGPSADELAAALLLETACTGADGAPC